MTTMTFTAERDTVSDLLASVSRAISTKLTIPAVGFIHLNVTGDTLTATGTDMDTTIRSTAMVSGKGDGSALVPTKLAQDIARRAKPGSLTFTSEGNNTVTITSGKAAFTVLSMSVEDYPRIDGPVGTPINVAATDLAVAFGQVSPAASSDPTRPLYTGVLFESTDTSLFLVATDGFRMIARELPRNAELGTDRSLIVPATAIASVAKLLSGETPAVELHLNANDVSFVVGSTTVTTRLISGAYSPWRKLIMPPAERLTVDATELTDVLRRISLIDNRVQLILSPNGVQVMAKSADAGEAIEELDGAWSGQKMGIWFDASRLLAGIAPFDGQITVDMSAPLKPATIKGSDATLTSVVMPVS